MNTSLKLVHDASDKPMTAQQKWRAKIKANPEQYEQYQAKLRAKKNEAYRLSRIGKEDGRAILNGPSRSGRAVIDHDHKTGTFRALLCSKCNLDLGMIESDEKRFSGLVEYLHKHNIRS